MDNCEKTSLEILERHKRILNRVRELLQEYVEFRNKKFTPESCAISEDLRSSFRGMGAWKMCPEAYQAGFDDAMIAVSKRFIEEVKSEK